MKEFKLGNRGKIPGIDLSGGKMTSIVTVIHQFFRKSPKMGNPSFPHDRKEGFRGTLSLFLLLVCVWVLFPVLSPLAIAASSQVMMKDGRILTGDAAPIESVAVSMAPRKKGENSPAGK